MAHVRTTARIGRPERRLQPLRGDLRPADDPRDGGARSRASAATPRTRSRAGTSAPRASPSPTSTPTPTGCAARCAGDRRRRWERDRLGRGLRPGRRRAGRRAISKHGRDAVGVYLGNPNVHSLGSMTHGTAMVQALRHPQPVQRHLASTSSRTSCVAHLMFGHQLLLPVPDLDRTVLLPGLRRQPDGLQRLPDDRARLPPAAARPEGPRRPDGGLRPAPHRDRQGRRPSTTSSGRAPTPFVLLAMLQVLFADGLATRAVVRRRAWAPCARPSSPPSPPSAPRRPAACRPTRSAGWPASSRPRDGRCAYGRVGVSTHAVRLGLPVGDQPAQHPHRQPRPASAARCSPPPPSTRSAPACRPRPPRPVAQPGARAARVGRRAAGGRARARRSRPPARARCGRMLTVAGNPVLSTPDGDAPRRRPGAAWTSWPPSTSTSTRPPGTPT